MGINQTNGSSNPQGIETLLRQPVGQRLEMRKRFRSHEILANHISAFAHAEGGTIVVGFDVRRKRVMGCRRERLASLFRKAEVRLRHGLATLEFHEIGGRWIGVILVAQVDLLIVAPGGLLVRQEVRLRAMKMEQILERLENRKERVSARDTAIKLAQLSTTVQTVHGILEHEANWWTKAKSHALGKVICLVIGAALTVLVQHASTWKWH